MDKGALFLHMASLLTLQQTFVLMSIVTGGNQEACHPAWNPHLMADAHRLQQEGLVLRLSLQPAPLEWQPTPEGRQFAQWFLRSLEAFGPLT